MMHPDTVAGVVSPQIGLGVFATKFIPKGTIVYVDDPFESDIAADSPLFDHPVFSDIIYKYATVGKNGRYSFSWDIAKHVNHCCYPNTLATGWDFEVAIQDIQPGEQIRDDYGLSNRDYQMKLSCERTECRKFIRAADFEKYADSWDRRILDALLCSGEVEQPLLAVMDENTRTELEHFLQSGEGYRSVREVKYNRL